MHHIGARAEHRLEQELLDSLEWASGGQALLYRTATAVERPDGSGREVPYPVVGKVVPMERVVPSLLHSAVVDCVARVIEGVIRHCTRLLGFQFLPPLKGIHARRL